MTKDSYDVIGAEVHRKALENLTKEMALTLSRTSGSSVVTEAKDFSCALLDEVGEQLAYSGFITIHLASSLLGVEATIQTHDIDDLKPGDAFLCNDPHAAGAQHQADMGIVSPFFHRDKLVGWGYSNQHVVDIGGMSISGMAPTARDVYSEALLFPSIRVVREGQLDPEWERFIANSVRSPGPVLNDLRSMIAANNVGQRKIVELIDRYGEEQFRAYCEKNKSLSEEALKAKIRKLPEGTYEAHDWVEYDGHGKASLYHVKLTMTVRGDALRFDFTTDQAQVEAFVNGTKASVWGQTMTALLVRFAFDIPVNAGIWRPLTIDVGPPGTIINSAPPAPVSCSHMETGMRISKLVSSVLSQACRSSADPELRARAAGQGADGFAGMSLWGINQYDQEDVILFMDACLGIGGGAQSVGDGMDGYGCTCMLGCGLPAVEIHESQHALIFLWRRLATNSGGPGWHRGGQGLDYAFAVTRRMTGPLYNSVADVPPRGFAGGLPGAAASCYAIRQTNLLELFRDGTYPEQRLIEGLHTEYRAKEGYVEFDEGDVFVTLGAGGGGLGDPLLREPNLVADDVRSGFITTDHAQSAYGVVVRNGTHNLRETWELRAEMRRQRLGRQPERATTSTKLPSVEPNNGNWRCTACDHLICATDDDWRTVAVTRESPIADRFDTLSMRVRRGSTNSVLMRECFCPSCGVCLTAEVELRGTHTISPRLVSQAGITEEPR